MCVCTISWIMCKWKTSKVRRQTTLIYGVWLMYGKFSSSRICHFFSQRMVQQEESLVIRLCYSSDGLQILCFLNIMSHNLWPVSKPKLFLVLSLQLLVLFVETTSSFHKSFSENNDDDKKPPLMSFMLFFFLSFFNTIDNRCFWNWRSNLWQFQALKINVKHWANGK